MNKALALRYLMFALLSTALAATAWPWTAVLLWPAAGWLWLALGYAQLGPRVWGKSAPAPARLLLWPVRALVHLGHRRRRQRRRDNEPVEIAEGLWFGPRLSRLEAERWLPRDVAVLDVAPEYTAGWGEGQTYLALDILEGTAPPAIDLLVVQIFIDMNRSKGVYIHSALGNSRAALLAATWLLRQYPRMTVEQAQSMLRALRPDVRFCAQQVRVLEELRLLQQQALTV